MSHAFLMALREGKDAFLIIALVLAYARTSQTTSVRALLWGIAASVPVSGVLGYLLWISQGAYQPIHEGLVYSAALVLTVMAGSYMHSKGAMSFPFIVGFAVFMISREMMEIALLLFQIQQLQMIAGILLGISAAGAIAWLWQQCGISIPMSRFRMIASAYVLLFAVQLLSQIFHEFTEAGILPFSETLHEASEPYSSEGRYGRLYGVIVLTGCSLWLAAEWARERFVGVPQR
ncbi:MAG: hypothetical protein Q8R76_10505 [Candidatus Omnitrophota bacterium]|nr:hypothetical protein [Candidatus Omnitrophota bacterium]